MITRKAKVREVLCRTLEDGSKSHSALIAFDEGAATTIRLTVEEYDELVAAVASGKRFSLCVREAAPTLKALASRDPVSP